MRVLITTVGTRGDVQPYLALAVGLKAAGHEVAICTCPRFESFITEYDIAFHPLDEGLLEILDTDFGRALVENINGLFSALRTVPKVLKQVGPIHRRMVADAWTATETFSPDVIVYHPKMFCVPAFAAKKQIAAVLALLYPMQVPTGELPFYGFPRLPFGRLYNRASYRIVQWLTKLGTRSYLKEWRKRHDPLGTSLGSGPNQTAPGKPIPVLHGFSEAVQARPADWPSHATVTGYWYLPPPTNESAKWKPPVELVDFLSAGPKPIYIGFGSMVGTKAEETTQTILKAIEAAKVRAIIATGWGGIDSNQLPPEVYQLESAPHDWLFPQVAAVIHHGGAGTTAAGLGDGCPTIICPLALDQPYWGRRVHELGAGPKPIPQKRLDSARLAAAITEVMMNPAIRENAHTLGERIRSEAGIEKAISAIEATHKAKQTN